MIPPRTNASPNGSNANSGEVCPLAHGARNPVNGHANISLGVVGLSLRGCPAAVFWAVVAFAIYALNGPPLGCVAHVFKEVRESSPSFTNPNPESTVALVIDRGRVFAPPMHSRPHAVNPSFCEAVGSGISSIPALRLVASAGASHAILERLSVSECRFSAITEAFPHELRPTLAHGGANHHEATEPLSAQVDDARMKRGIFCDDYGFGFRHPKTVSNNQINGKEKTHGLWDTVLR